MLFSVTTLTRIPRMSRRASSLDFTLDVSQVSFERATREIGPLISISL